MNELLVIKIGGNIIDDEEKLSAFVRDFSMIEGNKILVHGGGKIASAIGTRLGIIPDYHNGRRITDAATLELVTMVYGGLVNKRIVALLQSHGVPAIGLTGCDGDIIKAKKRPVRDIDFGFVGDVTSDGVNTDVLGHLLLGQLVPILAPLTHDGHGTLLNTNADTIAQEVAKAFASFYRVKLFYCFEKAGVLRDSSNEASLIASIEKNDLRELIQDNIVTDGMIPKLENAFRAIDAGVESVVIGSGNNLSGLINGESGTTIQ